MGKYKESDYINTEKYSLHRENQLRLDTLNELAEGNRLKRLEFQNYYCKDCRHSINPEKLEDQA